MIRPAKYTDIENISAIGEMFYNEAKFSSKGLNIDLDSFKALLFQLINNSESIVLVCEIDGKIVGTIAGAIAPWILDTKQKILQELWWFVDPNYRGFGHKLLEAFEIEAKNLGVSFILMITLDSNYENKLIKYYKRNNYKHLEHHFIKRLN